MNFLAFSCHKATKSSKKRYEYCLITATGTHVVNKFTKKRTPISITNKKRTLFMNNVKQCEENTKNPDIAPKTWKLDSNIIPICNLEIFSIRFPELIPVLAYNLSRKNVPCRTCVRSNVKSELCAEVLATQLKTMIKYL
jgi:hypothetical protein